jgi:hypothetical protein
MPAIVALLTVLFVLIILCAAVISLGDQIPDGAELIFIEARGGVR